MAFPVFTQLAAVLICPIDGLKLYGKGFQREKASWVHVVDSSDLLGLSLKLKPR